jgi:8-oxo-dGTP diphosphatase
MDTVLPYLHKYKIKHSERSQLSELGAKNGPKRTAKLIDKLVEAGKGAVICSHRPALPTIVKALGAYANKDQRKELDEVLSMKPAQLFVVHMSKGTGKKPAKIVAIETVVPTFDD